jgi:hypothetical protein
MDGSRKILNASLIFALMFAAVPAPLASQILQAPVGDVVFEIVGQVRNPTAPTSHQYGFLSNVRGVPLAQIFDSAPPSETAALFTFFTVAENTQVINNGNLRVVNRTGTTTIYYDRTHGDFANPESFRDGVPLLVMSLRQQVILDLAEGTFSATNINTITSVAPITVGSIAVADPGDQFRTSINGRTNTNNTPAAFVIAGYAVAIQR